MATPLANLDSRFVTAISLEPYFVDKSTGEPLANGKVYFWEDQAHNVPKLVYQLTGGPGNYAYAPLPNPITLSAVGTIEDAAGNNLALYYFPFDATGAPQLYFIQVFDQYGVEQFTRQAWPFPNGIGGLAGGAVNDATNMITNPQFAEVNFVAPGPYTLGPLAAGIYSFSIAAGWTLNFTVGVGGAGQIRIQRNSITGVTANPSNPPYTLLINPLANITALTLSQRLNNNPDIWSPKNAGSNNGYVAASILLANNSELTIRYAPSGSASQQILAFNNTSGSFQEHPETTKLNPATNPDNSNTGFVDIVLVLPTAKATELSNVQVLGIQSNIQGIVFDQSTVNRQFDQMFNYYNPYLQYKPLSSYLVGWDFPFNPTQPLGPAVGPFATGANTSNYFWDQLIIYQANTNSVSADRSPTGSGALKVFSFGTNGFALVQYLPQNVARKILNGPLSVNVSAITNQPGGIIGTVSLWWTANALLPSTGANLSLVNTLNVNGYPNLPLNQGGAGDTWHEVPRSLNGTPIANTQSLLGNAQFTVQNSANTNFNDYGFNGWNTGGVATNNTATFFAIVVGFGPLLAGNFVEFDSISLVQGNIPTRPAEKNQAQTLEDCCFYFQTSFLQGTVPATAIGLNTGELGFVATQAGASVQRGQSYYFPYAMNDNPTITLFNPSANNAQARNVQRAQDCAATVVDKQSAKNFNITCTGSLNTNVSDDLVIHYTADARLGL